MTSDSVCVCVCLITYTCGDERKLVLLWDMLIFEVLLFSFSFRLTHVSVVSSGWGKGGAKGGLLPPTLDATWSPNPRSECLRKGMWMKGEVKSDSSSSPISV